MFRKIRLTGAEDQVVSMRNLLVLRHQNLKERKEIIFLIIRDENEKFIRDLTYQ
jgi:hypothetical protein